MMTPGHETSIGYAGTGRVFHGLKGDKPPGAHVRVKCFMKKIKVMQLKLVM